MGEKFYLLSDLHLEFDPDLEILKDIPTDKRAGLILAGDIFSGQMPFENIQIFLDTCSKRFGRVFYIPGNHEYYGCDFKETRNFLNAPCWNFKLPHNVFGINRKVLNFGNYRIAGATLWTDLSNPTNACMARNLMADFTHIRGFNIDTWNSQYVQDRDFLRQVIEVQDSRPLIIVTHHLPTFAVVSPKYKNDPLTPAFASNCESLLTDRVHTWCFGHTHESVNLRGERPSLICNPRGYYGHDLNINFNPVFSFEV